MKTLAGQFAIYKQHCQNTGIGAAQRSHLNYMYGRGKRQIVGGGDRIGGSDYNDGSFARHANSHETTLEME